MISGSLITKKMCKLAKIYTLWWFYSEFYANHEIIYAGAARRARDISELWDKNKNKVGGYKTGPREMAKLSNSERGELI